MCFSYYSLVSCRPNLSKSFFSISPYSVHVSSLRLRIVEFTCSFAFREQLLTMDHMNNIPRSHIPATPIQSVEVLQQEQRSFQGPNGEPIFQLEPTKHPVDAQTRSYSLLAGGIPSTYVTSQRALPTKDVTTPSNHSYAPRLQEHIELEARNKALRSLSKRLIEDGHEQFSVPTTQRSQATAPRSRIPTTPIQGVEVLQQEQRSFQGPNGEPIFQSEPNWHPLDAQTQSYSVSTEGEFQKMPSNAETRMANHLAWMASSAESRMADHQAFLEKQGLLLPTPLPSRKIQNTGPNTLANE